MKESKKSLEQKIKNCQLNIKDLSIKTQGYGKICFLLAFGDYDCKYGKDFVSYGEKIYKRCHKRHEEKQI